MRSNLYLIDTSVWLEVLPRKATTPLRERVDALLAADRVAITGMVRLELLGGARDEGSYLRLGKMLAALHPLPVAEEQWDEAAGMAFVLRRRGVIVPFTDVLIASIASAAGATLLHRDHHYDLIAGHTGLSVESALDEYRNV